MPPLVMEPIRVEGRISGNSIIADLLHRIRERLERNNDLRETDSYSSYSARIAIDLNLVDVDTAQVIAEIVVGQPAQRPPPAASGAMVLDVTPVVASAVGERLGAEAVMSNLERSVDGSPVEARALVQPNLERPIVDPTPESPAAGKRSFAPKKERQLPE